MEIEEGRDVPKFRPYEGVKCPATPWEIPQFREDWDSHPILCLPTRPQTKVLEMTGDYGDSLEAAGPGPRQGNQVATRGRPW